MPENQAVPRTEIDEPEDAALCGNNEGSELVLPKVERLEPSATARTKAVSSKKAKSSTMAASPIRLVPPSVNRKTPNQADP